jgi:DNA mismatch repair protein MutS
MAENLTPLMAQYQQIKSRHPEEILMFRLGDFYEMFNEDAHTAHRVLGITLTARFTGEKKVPMAGVPYHSAQSYIGRLLKAGHRVALCEQMEDPEDADGRIVDRQVVRIITPGTLLEELSLNERRNNYLAAVDSGALAWADLSTGSFMIEDLSSPQHMTDEITRLAPSECLVPADAAEALRGRVQELVASVASPPDWPPEETARRELCGHLGVADLAGFGVDSTRALGCAAALLRYLKETQKGPLEHIRKIAVYSGDRRMVLDRHSQRALELVESATERRVEGSLLWILDRCETSMGSRVLRDWILAPLRAVDEIVGRLEAIEELSKQDRALWPHVRAVGDLERLGARLGSGRATPRDLAGLRDSIGSLPELRSSFSPAGKLLQEIRGRISEHSDLRAFLQRAIVEAPPHAVGEGGIIRKGFDAELDKLTELRENARGVLNRLAEREVQRTGIGSLKVGFNSVFGYYIEITHAHSEKVPADYVRKQTLKNAERYITAELKDLETQILNAEESSRKLERRLFEQVRARAAEEIAALQETARAVAELDALGSMARVAAELGWIRPEVDDSRALEIEGGRHPVLERILAGKLVANDTRLDGEGSRILLITGPNMAGKSTYLRQSALIALLAQIGSFVPARRARIGRIDRIFTRVGASDEIARGVSTFMQEMVETANILHHATDRSLVVLDELGRGTSTYDGVSIAWAVCEHLHQKTRARTLFATHYHELVELSRTLTGVRNLHAAVQEWKGKIVFLYRIVEGATNRSYGIHVAQLAGLPKEAIERAGLILRQLEEVTSAAGANSMLQLSLFTARESAPPPLHPILQELKCLDPDTLSPLEALQKLAEWSRALQHPTSGA